ncbi:MAG TPA: hypothetical protein VHP83_01280 [Aggregatilineaceae bacterium]|nr:hypothetical protein [Aggregatilineaceae bacterium]
MSGKRHAVRSQVTLAQCQRRGPPLCHWQGDEDGGRDHNPKTDIVVPVVRIVVVAVHAAGVVLIVVPRPAPHHTPRELPGNPTNQTNPVDSLIIT